MLYVASQQLDAIRFLSLCSTMPSESIVPEQITDEYNRLKQSSKSITIDAAILASPVIYPLSEAIGYDRSLEKLYVSNLDISALIGNKTLALASFVLTGPLNSCSTFDKSFGI